MERRGIIREKKKSRDAEERKHRGIIVYLEYKSVCPIVGIGSPTPYPASECFSPA
jgi:hypothetical protein